MAGGHGKGELSYPYDICVDRAGRQYVCEFGNSRIQVFDAHDQPMEIIGGPGADPGGSAIPGAWRSTRRAISTSPTRRITACKSSSRNAAETAGLVGMAALGAWPERQIEPCTATLQVPLYGLPRGPVRR